MENLEQLRIKRQMLMLEMNMIEQKIAFLEATTTVTDVPESESLKTKAIPEQTAPGKETTNPLKAEVLLKSLIKVNTEPSSSSDSNSKLVNTSPSTLGKGKLINLATNKNMQEQVLKPDYLRAAKREEIRYYVIYKGPHSGIYTNWGEVKDICEADKVISRKFASIEQAKLDLEIYGGGPYKNPLLLRPKIKAEKKKEEHRDQRFKNSVHIENPEPIVFFDEFRQLWNKAREACQEDFLHEKFFTTDKLTKSLFNFVEGADPILIYQSFRAGLINNIYPSNNLLELKEFPSPIVLAIKNFRKKVLKAKDSPIYIKVISSIPDWNHEENYSPYHFIEIGLASTKKELQHSTFKIDDPSRSLLDTLAKIRVQNLKRIAEQILLAISEGERRINYADSHCIITSRSFTGSTEEDNLTLQQYGLPFLKNTIEASGTTKGAFCLIAKQLFEEHSCNYCQDKVESKEEKMVPKAPTTEEESNSD